MVYTWGNTAADSLAIDSPYDNTMKLIRLHAGPDSLHSWIVEEIDIAADYQRYFGQDPPATAKIAFMCDSDNAESGAESRLDFIEVSLQNTHKK